MSPSKRALISVYDKEGIEDFAQGLVELGFSLVSSGGTARHLKEKGLEVTDVADITGFPAILSHRVVTLHPKIHGGILALDTPEHEADLLKYEISRFQLVCNDLYPVTKTIAENGVGVDRVMEMTDIGGPTMIRGAAKNFKKVIVICDPKDRGWIIKELKLSGDLNEAQRLLLAEKVFGTMAAYDDAIRRFLAEQNGNTIDTLVLQDGRELAYAENRYQNPAHLLSLAGGDDPLGMNNFTVESGDPSYISIADGSQILEILCLIAEAFRRWKGAVPYIAVAGKHGNPCGAAFSLVSGWEAVTKALLGDGTAVMGGEVVTNFSITPQLAEALFDSSSFKIGRKNWGLDIILAPEFSPEAIDLLGSRERRRLLSNEALFNPSLSPNKLSYRPVRGGFLRQMAPDFILTPEAVQQWSGKPLSDEDFASLIIAWACGWRASSNTVALAKDGMLIGLGCGQQDRIACVRLCLDRANKAGHNLVCSVFASDAFFPYAESPSELSDDDAVACHEAMTRAIELMNNGANANDIIREIVYSGDIARCFDKREGPQLLADAGCMGGIVPADGKELLKVQEFFEKRLMSVAFIAPKFRGFSKH